MEKAVNTIARATRKKAIKRFVSESGMFDDVGPDVICDIGYEKSFKIRDELTAKSLILGKFDDQLATRRLALQ